MKRYETYKDSVIQSGEIPENWNQKPFSALFKLMNRKNFPNKELLSVYLDKGVIRFRDIEEKRTNVTSEDLTGYQLVKKGDFVINNQQAWRGSVGVSKYEGIISPAYLVLEFKENFHPNFANYLLRNISVVSKYLISSKGVGTIQRNLYWPSLKSVYLNYPSLSEQLAIASFLDNKTAKIDQTISIKEKEIELLKERRQILIQKAVTKGLDDKVKLKDSGVEWIGEVPEHWEVRKLMGVCRFIRGNSPFGKDELLEEGEYVAIQYGKAYKVNEVNKEYGYYVNNEFYKKSQVVSYGDIILISTSETIDDLGHTVYYRRNDLGLLGGEQIMLKPKQEEINSQYLYFTSKVFSKELRKFATGIKVFRFNINDLKTIFTVLPPLSEQNEIANYIETKSTKISKAISLKQQEIEKLKEYKTVLIDNVVTGKVKVS
ncbi:restriction endonuclease subunit S [Elizabethkingia anophelis]|uniref:restriction endonuclease subunit S n=1 Tax=Elizabethkingia anophelis TaxID=1117645 RepID=UPI0021A38A07|nr:restriction endonuclease subunit S [Elizabethkingia anophelis]MCT3871670.1 restriction endonuclease subunit S [Elizabethkingia anophelis]MDV3847367.1 restriction endonuclease subunit S [Elizabethkingia anophelis]